MSPGKVALHMRLDESASEARRLATAHACGVAQAVGALASLGFGFWVLLVVL